MISKKYFYIAQTIGICCIILTLVTPLLLDPATIFPFVILKTTLFRLLTTIIFLMAITILAKVPLSNNGWAKIFKRNIILFSLFIFLLATILSMIFGVDSYNSFFSGGERMNGVIAWIYFVLFVGSATVIILTTKNARVHLYALLETNTIVSCLVGFTAILSYKTGFLLESFKNNRLAGFSGNPAYLSSYMLLCAFLSLYLFFGDEFKKFKLKWLYLSCFIFQSLILFGTGTRGAMLGWFAGIFVFLLYTYIKYRNNTIGKLSLATIGFGLILILSVFLLKNTELVKNNIGLNRLASISVKDITAQSRLYSAKSALLAWKEKPIFGWGLENYKSAFLPHVMPGMVANNPNDITFDKAHNMPLEILATTGIVGLFCYITILMAIGITLKRLYVNGERDNEKFQIIILTAGLTGYFIANLFLFDIFESYLLFAVYCLLISILDIREKIEYNYQYHIPNYKIFGVALITIVSIGVSYAWIIRPYIESRQFFTANQYLKSNNFERSKEIISEILKHESLITRNGLNSYLKVFLTTPGYLTNPKAIEISVLLNKEYLSLIKKYPNYFDLRSDHISLLVNSFYEDPIKLKEAEEEQSYLVSYAPNYLYYIDHLAFIYGLEGKYDLAQKEITKALNLSNKMPEPYWYQGIIYNMSGNPLSIDFFYKALRLGYAADIDEISKIVNLALKYEKYSYLPDLYSLALVLEPNNIQIYASLAAAYQKIGDYNNARITAEKMLALDPAVKPQVDAFLKTLPAIK